jgi:hypothetical protein
VILFCGKVNEWPILSEKMLAKAKRYGFKDLLIQEQSTPKVDDYFDGILEEGKKLLKVINLYEIV